MRLENKVTLITGGADGIGRGIALRFAAEGAKVGVLDINETKCRETVQMIRDQGGLGMVLGADVSNPDRVHWAVGALARSFGPISIVIHNAGVIPAGKLHESSLEDFERAIAVNLRGVYLVNRAVIPMMLQHRKGSIIHVASSAGILGVSGLAVYSATQGALLALTRAMSTDYARLGIRVNAVSPGVIDTPEYQNFLAARPDGEKMQQAFEDLHPMGRVGTIEEIANVCVFLSSDEASFVTGANYTVDGGLSVKGEQPQAQ